MRKFLNRTIMARLGYHLTKVENQEGVYDHDGLYCKHNHDFMQDPAFVAAYERGVKSARQDYQWYWRMHTGLWAADVASRLPGDFVECGVNWGCLGTAIMQYLDWDKLGKMFYLLDTFTGLDPELLSEAEKQSGAVEYNRNALKSGFYTSGVEAVKENFSPWKNWRIIQGRIPETLKEAQPDAVAYLHLDMNCSAPEVAAAEYFWPRMVKGGLILLDDYGAIGFRLSKQGMDQFARKKNVKVLSLPTGQGLIIKP
jgi:hypothetical protein